MRSPPHTESLFTLRSFGREALSKFHGGHQVFISEYKTPADFSCIWEKGAKTTFSWHAENLSTKESVERLFVFEG